jgi:tuftelin-interacting protein 11
MQIDPRHPDPTPLTAALAWHTFPALHHDTLVRTLETTFFATWLGVLRAWLVQESRVLSELADWYAGWRALWPASLVARSARLRLLFNHALDLLKCVCCFVCLL